VTAPDFFPLADQIELVRDPSIGRTEPLSFGRLPANPTLPGFVLPAGTAFDRDRTITAIVGAVASGPPSPAPRSPNRSISFLPDGASNVFAPGWDTSRSRDDIGLFLTSSGLGSPFPEDAKLCAALASFWPAVAPDAGRTFGNEGFDNQLPMLDAELGFHPQHGRVVSGQIPSHRGWDGEFGPFFETVGDQLHVNYVTIEGSDYVSHALEGRIKVSLTAEVQSEDLIARHQALNACKLKRFRSRSQLCLVVFRKIGDWSTFPGGHSGLRGGGFLLEFAELADTESVAGAPSRVRRAVEHRHTCQVSDSKAAYRRDAHAFAISDR